MATAWPRSPWSTRHHSCAPGRYARCDRESSVVPVEGPDSGRRRRFARGPSHETRLQFVQRIGDAYGLVLVLILTTFVVTMTLPPQGWGGQVVAVAIAGLTAVIGLTSSDVPLRRVRFAAGAALAAVIATALAKPVSSDVLLGAAFVVDSLLLAVAAVTILHRVVPSAMVDFRTILGAISVFTLLGLLFGFLFLALGRLQGGDVFTGVSDAQARDYLFFSYTTLTTTGYGNLVPAGDIGQILATSSQPDALALAVAQAAGFASADQGVTIRERESLWPCAYSPISDDPLARSVRSGRSCVNMSDPWVLSQGCRRARSGAAARAARGA
jgi:hypothetical protein